jgi:hypothetical protein
MTADATTANSNIRIFQIACAVLGLVIVIATCLGGSILSAKTRQGPRIFSNWFRHLTNWNAIFCTLWLFVVASSRLERANTTLLSFGYFALLMNLFVLFVRWGWFRVSSMKKNASWFFSDLIIHALVPVVVGVSVFMVVEGSGVDWKDQRNAVLYGILAFWVVAVLWYGINFLLKKLKIVSWPYPNGAGKSLPKDIYGENRTPKAFWFYMATNLVVALTLSSLLFCYVFARQESK